MAGEGPRPRKDRQLYSKDCAIACVTRNESVGEETPLLVLFPRLINLETLGVEGFQKNELNAGAFYVPRGPDEDEEDLTGLIFALADAPYCRLQTNPRYQVLQSAFHALDEGMQFRVDNFIPVPGYRYNNSQTINHAGNSSLALYSIFTLHTNYEK